MLLMPNLLQQLGWVTSSRPFRTRRWCIDKLGIFYPHLELRVRLVPLNMFKPSNIFTDRSKTVLLLWTLFVIHVLVLACLWITSWKSFLVFCHFLIWCLCSGVVLDCIESWSLPSLLSLAQTICESWAIFLVLS